MFAIPKNFLISPRKRFIRGSFIILGIFFLILWFWNRQDYWKPNTLWVIDNSLSMAVTDIHTEKWISISRLDLVKKFVTDESKNITGNMAIITAANGARLELPMTQDHKIFQEVLSGINLISRWWWSSLSTPLETIRLIYGDTPNLNIIWLTDGEFADSGSTLSGFTSSPNIIFVGVGTPEGWPILEWYNSEWLSRFKESQGKTIVSIRDDKKLKNISKLFKAQLILKNSDSAFDSELISKNTTQSSKNFSKKLIFWFFLIVIGLMFPRYQYILQKNSWK